MIVKPFITFFFKIIFFMIVPPLKLSAQTQRKIEFPDIAGYYTLISDLHQHTVFSDGSVWTDIRVKEAIFDGLDVISLTEHLEYQPHNKDIPHPDRNRSYQLAKEFAKNEEIIIIHGAEITRDLPPGHCNALFINDATIGSKELLIHFARPKNKEHLSFGTILIG